jgi:hypothetical protein
VKVRPLCPSSVNLAWRLKAGEKQESSDTSGAKWLSIDKTRFRANSPHLIQCGQLLASLERHHFKTMRHLIAEQEQLFERKLSAATILKRHEISSTKLKEDDHERVCISLSGWRGWQVP